MTGLERVRAGDLRESAGNPRRHPAAQRDAVRALLREVGYADALLAYRDDAGALVLFDGHLRRGLDADQVVPVLVTDLSPDEAALMLAAGDYTAGLADVDPAAMAELAARLEPTDAEARALVAELEAEGRLMAELEGDLEGTGGARGGGGAGDREKWAAKVVRVVIAVEELAPIEAALDVAGGATRGQALLRVCREWLAGHAEAQRDG